MRTEDSGQTQELAREITNSEILRIRIILGIFSFGFINELTGSQRSSVLALMIFFVAGLLMLFYAASLKNKNV